MLNEKRTIQIFTPAGAQIGVVTRMSNEDLMYMLLVNDDPWVSIDGLTPQDDHVIFRLKRDQVLGFFIGPVPSSPQKSNLALPRGVKL